MYLNKKHYIVKPGVNIEQVNKSLIYAVNNMAGAAGVTVTITDGFRTYEQQDYYYKLYKSGQGSLAAAPGTGGPHERGAAIDIGYCILWDYTNQQFMDYGLARPYYIPGSSLYDEKWHLELSK